MDFSITTRARADVATVRPRGELDAGNAHTVQTHLAAAVTGSRVVVVDLSRVTFLDCATIGIFLTEARHAARRGGRLVLAEARPTARLLLDLLELGPVLGGHRTVTDEQSASASALAC